MKGLVIYVSLTLLVVSEARPGVVTPRPVSTSNNAEENYVRVRRHFDYEEYMNQFWEKFDRPCPDCQVNNIGNGYKNSNEVHATKTDKSHQHNGGTLNVGNGRKNINKVYLGEEPKYNLMNIGNGSGNKNTVYFGAKPGSVNEDHFSGSFWND